MIAIQNVGSSTVLGTNKRVGKIVLYSIMTFLKNIRFMMTLARDTLKITD